MVSGTISLPSRGTFHHSLTVLSAIGHTEYLGLPGGPGRFTTDSTSPLLLGNTTTPGAWSSCTGLSPTTVGHPKPVPLTTHHTRPASSLITSHPTTPHAQPLPGITHTRFSLIHVRSPLLAESLLFSLPAGTEMFHFPASPPPHYEFT